jgi:hypothetical protein
MVLLYDIDRGKHEGHLDALGYRPSREVD